MRPYFLEMVSCWLSNIVRCDRKMENVRLMTSLGTPGKLQQNGASKCILNVIGLSRFPAQWISRIRLTEQTPVRQRAKGRSKTWCFLSLFFLTVLKAEFSQACHPAQQCTVSVCCEFFTKALNQTPTFMASIRRLFLVASS